MDGICRDCLGTGVIDGSDGVAPLTCSCRAGKEIARQDTEVRIPSSELEEYAYDQMIARMNAENKHPCRGDHWCTHWVVKPEKYCDTCKKHICD